MGMRNGTLCSFEPHAVSRKSSAIGHVLELWTPPKAGVPLAAGALTLYALNFAVCTYAREIHVCT